MGEVTGVFPSPLPPMVKQDQSAGSMSVFRKRLHQEVQKLLHGLHVLLLVCT